MEKDDAFGNDLVRYLPDLRRYAMSLSGRTADAEEIVQETMRKAMELRDTYRPGTDIRPWLFALQFNAHRSFVKEAVRRRTRETYEPAAAEAYPVPASQEDYILFSEAEELIERLPRDQKSALYCVVFDGMSYKQAATKLECSEGTVKSRISRAKDALLAMVRDSEPEPQLAAAPGM